MVVAADAVLFAASQYANPQAVARRLLNRGTIGSVLMQVQPHKFQPAVMSSVFVTPCSCVWQNAVCFHIIPAGVHQKYNPGLLQSLVTKKC